MRLTREQIKRIAKAVELSEALEFYVEKGSDERLRFGEFEVVERQKPIPLTTVGKKKEPAVA